MPCLKSVCTASCVATLAILCLAPPARAQGPSSGTDKPYTDAHRLGTSTSFNGAPLTDAASVKRMAARRGIADDIRKLLRDSGLSETSDAVLATLSAPTSAVKGGRCRDMSPQDGVMVECEFQPGDTIEWMAHRPRIGKGDRTPDRLIALRWAGKPFSAFLFRVTTNDTVYTFMLPKLCGNLSLVSEAAKPAPPVAEPVVVPAPAPTPLPAPTPTPAPLPAPTPVPMPIATPTAEPAAVLTPAPSAAASMRRQDNSSVNFFVDGLVGKDRRVRPVGDRTTIGGFPVFPNAGNGEFAQCSPLFGVKFGVAKRWANDWELAGAAGVAFSLETDDNQVREHQVLVDVEVNKYVGKHDILLGTGISFWDITHSDSFEPAWLFHVGAPLGTQRVFLMGEGRLFFRHFDNIENNYQLWAGVRVRF